jgi:arginyl-tRNA synthetase
MSGRKGLGVKADDLINRLEASALSEVQTRHPELSETDQFEIAHSIAVGALRYFLLKFTRNSVIAFDFKEALAFEGETGTYCQNAAVRANSIFRKLEPDAPAASRALLAQTQTDEGVKAKVSEFMQGESGTEVWSLLVLAARLEESNAQAAASAEPAFLAKYAFNLARAFNLFYHRHRIIAEENELKRAVLIAVANYTRQQLTAALATLGIGVPERM